MIVFKAECGHTVRARDEDAGGVVRCSYCGRNASVPETEGGNLDFLLEEIEQAALPAEEKRRRRLFRRRPAVREPRKEGQFDPFGIILRLCYFALLLVIVIIVTRKFVLPLFRSEEDLAKRMSGESPKAVVEVEKKEMPPVARGRAYGLITSDSLSGLYVSSAPRGAIAYVVEESRAPAKGRIHRVAGAASIQTDGTLPGLADGSYVVETAFAWNDTHLSDPNLPNYQEYLAFRRSIERSSEVQRKQLIEDYFVPDEATEAFVAEADERLFFVRQYRGIVVTQGRSRGVRSLFLPKLGKRDGRAFSIEPLVVGYLRDARAYAFDEAHVRNELTYYGVPESDQRLVIEAMSRIGAIPFPTPDGRTRMFKIDIHDGAFTARVLREAIP